jgi:hypothetical protein
MIEASVADILLLNIGGTTEQIDNPFDAIYLSSLRPDLLNAIDTDQIVTGLSIQDLSESIHFVDEWED